jgi:hypothetical protein
VGSRQEYFCGKSEIGSWQPAKCHRTAIQNIFPRSHITAGTVRHDFKLKKKTLSQDICNAAVRWKHGRLAIAIESFGCNSVVQTLQDCSTYIVKLSRKSLTMLAAPVRTSCAFTAHYRSIMATEILQASHRHYKMTAPGECHTRMTSPPHPHPQLFLKKMFNSALDYLRSLQQQLSQLPPCLLRRIARSSQEIDGKSAAEELQTHRRPFGTDVSYEGRRVLSYFKAKWGF